MDADALGTKLAQDILALSGEPPDGPAFAGSKKYWDVVAKDIIDHIKTKAEVPSGITVSTPDYVSGSTTGKGRVT
jgi:hypothetical protein